MPLARLDPSRRRLRAQIVASASYDVGSTTRPTCEDLASTTVLGGGAALVEAGTSTEFGVVRIPFVVD